VTIYVTALFLAGCLLLHEISHASVVDGLAGLVTDKFMRYSSIGNDDILIVFAYIIHKLYFTAVVKFNKDELIKLH
jgi:hypothetical protein